MKMWDEVADPEAPEAMMRKNTEEWVRELFKGPHPPNGWTVNRIHDELMELNADLQRAGQPRTSQYQAKWKFINELLMVLEGEDLIKCTYTRMKGRRGRVVGHAIPVRENA